MELSRILSLLIIPALMAGCGTRKQEVPENSLSFDDVVYVHDTYPIDFTLPEGVPAGLDIIGINNFTICDSMMLLSTQDKLGQIYVVDLDDMQVLGKFIAEGRGPGELTETVYVDNIKFYNDSGHTVGLWFPLNGIHELRRFDLTESLRTGKTVLEIFKLGLDGGTWLSDAVPMPDSRFLVYLSGRERKSISRFILSQDGKTSVTW